MPRGSELGKKRSLDSKILQKEANDQVLEGTNLHELGIKFESDKAKLEEAIEMVQNSMISIENKREMIAQLEDAIEKLREQYDREVTAEEFKVKKKLESCLESMQEAADELKREADSLRKIQMDAASTDASSAAADAVEQKQIFENMKNEYVEELKFQMEQADAQKWNIINGQVRELKNVKKQYMTGELERLLTVGDGELMERAVNTTENIEKLRLWREKLLEDSSDEDSDAKVLVLKKQQRM